MQLNYNQFRADLHKKIKNAKRNYEREIFEKK